MKKRHSQRKLIKKKKKEKNISHPILSYSHQNFHWRWVSRCPQIGYTLYRLYKAAVLQREAVTTAALSGSQRDCVPSSDLAGFLLKMPSPCSTQTRPISEAVPGQDNVHLVQGSCVSTNAPGDACLSFLHWIDQDSEGCVGMSIWGYHCICRAVRGHSSGVLTIWSRQAQEHYNHLNPALTVLPMPFSWKGFRIII